MKFITIKESHYQTDLIVLKSRLESEGILCRFKNELTTQILNHVPSFLVELQVPENDVPRVREILIETGELLPENTKLICPKCGSEKVKMKIGVLKRITLFFAILYSLTANLPTDKLFKRVKYYCKNCGIEFAN